LFAFPIMAFRTLFKQANERKTVRGKQKQEGIDSQCLTHEITKRFLIMLIGMTGDVYVF